MAAFSLLLCDRLSGAVRLANQGLGGKLWVPDGYIYLTEGFQVKRERVVRKGERKEINGQSGWKVVVST